MAKEIPITAFCLCIPEREFFWKQLAIQCESVGISFYPCIPNDNTELAHKLSENFKYGRGIIDHRWKHALAFMSHYEMIYLAKSNNLPMILMLEDDAYITERYLKVFNKLKEQIKNIDFDIIYFGWWISDEDDYFNNSIEFLWEKYEKCGLMKIRQSVGLHGALINKSAYNTILNMKCIDCMDSQLGKTDLNCYAILPKIIHTRSIKSQMENVIMNRKKIPMLEVREYQ